jgi:hypothetical protein
LCFVFIYLQQSLFDQFHKLLAEHCPPPRSANVDVMTLSTYGTAKRSSTHFINARDFFIVSVFYNTYTTYRLQCACKDSDYGVWQTKPNDADDFSAPWIDGMR